MTHRGVAPIVVLEQRLIEPDEAFVRWTRTEIEKQARWIRNKLDDRRNQFMTAVSTAEQPLFAAMRAAAMPWSQLEAMARADGHHHLVADPEPVIKLAGSRQLAWTTAERQPRATDGFYRPVAEVEYHEVLRWLSSMPNVLLFIRSFDWSRAEGGDKLALLDASDTYGLRHLVAGKLFIPPEFAKREVLPRLMVDLANKFSARACNGDDAQRPLNSRTSSALLHLYHDDTTVPDVFSDEWKSRLWTHGYELDEARLKFVLERARDGVLVPIIERQHSDNGLAVSRSSFKMFFERYDRERNVERVEAGVFPEVFSEAKWSKLWSAG